MLSIIYFKSFFFFFLWSSSELSSEVGVDGGLSYIFFYKVFNKLFDSSYFEKSNSLFFKSNICELADIFFKKLDYKGLLGDELKLFCFSEFFKVF